MLTLLSEGFTNASWWVLLLTFILVAQTTILCVTLYLHRSQSHRSITFHPAVSHFMRFYLWLTTGMVTKEWVAIHRKHHAFTDQEGDPHSPNIFGIKKVFWEGVELYRQAAKDVSILQQYGNGTPNDWIERNIYSRFSWLGPTCLAILYLMLFGSLGMLLWAFQMMVIPIGGAGFINGFGHLRGYRNFDTKDNSTNIIPLGIFMGGEELHNNHHKFPTSPKLSVNKFEFDLGYMVLKILEKIGLAKMGRK